MKAYLLVGCIVGIALWLCKFGLTIAVLPRSWNKWLHNNPYGLIILDTTFGLIAMKTIAAAGAAGLTTLIALVAYGCCTGLLILKYLIKRKAYELKERYI